jgi:hypothetical protein
MSMHVTKYQIEKVINVYTRKLGRVLETQKGQSLPRSTGSDSITLSDEGKRRAVLERINTDILEKIGQQGLLARSGQNFSELVDDTCENNAKPGAGAFVFNVIGEDQEKATTAVSLDENDAFMQPLIRR